MGAHGSRAAWFPHAAVAWRAFWASRLIVWAAGLAAVAIFGLSRRRLDFDQPGLTRPFGDLGDALVAPAARWDSYWFLSIARDGYDGARAAFFPLYPLIAAARRGAGRRWRAAARDRRQLRVPSDRADGAAPADRDRARGRRRAGDRRRGSRCSRCRSSSARSTASRCSSRCRSAPSMRLGPITGRWPERSERSEPRRAAPGCC